MGCWGPSKAQAKAFATKMCEVEDYCAKHGIEHSASTDSYYFEINGERYRVRNHTVAQSNRAAFDRNGNKIRGFYHEPGEYDHNHEITAGKTRIIEIHKALVSGKKLDKRGRVIGDAVKK